MSDALREGEAVDGSALSLLACDDYVTLLVLFE